MWIRTGRYTAKFSSIMLWPTLRPFKHFKKNIFNYRWYYKSKSIVRHADKDPDLEIAATKESIPVVENPDLMQSPYNWYNTRSGLWKHGSGCTLTKRYCRVSCSVSTWLLVSVRNLTTSGKRWVGTTWCSSSATSWQYMAMWGTCSINSARTLGS